MVSVGVLHQRAKENHLYLVRKVRMPTLQQQATDSELGFSCCLDYLVYTDGCLFLAVLAASWRCVWTGTFSYL
ncbi:hypothetical protein GOP47_0023357, partial [Adiantum capillus-veneris]